MGIKDIYKPIEGSKVCYWRKQSLRNLCDEVFNKWVEDFQKELKEKERLWKIRHRKNYEKRKLKRLNEQYRF